MPVIGTLTVNLEANTAKFSGDLGKASNDVSKFGRGAKEAGEGAEYSMGEARHGVMLLGEEFGVRMPRAVSGFIASIGPVGAAMEAAFPFLAIVAGATILIEHFSKLDEAAKKAAEASEHAFSSATKSLTEATEKSLELQIELNKLSGGPVKDLETKLASVKNLLAGMRVNPELKSEFEELGKAIDIHTPSGFNPLHWFDGVRIASEQVKLESERASKAIQEASTLEEKQAATVRELTAARLYMSTVETYGNQQTIEDQQKLISLLDITQQKFSQDISAQESAKKIVAKKEEIEQVKKAAEEKKKTEEESTKDLISLLSAQAAAEAAYTKSLKKEATEQNAVMHRAALEIIKAHEHLGQEQQKIKERNAKMMEKIGLELYERQVRIEEQKNRRILSAERQFDDSLAQGLTRVLTMQEGFGQMMQQLGAQLVSGILENSIKAILANDMTKPSDAKAAARKAYLAGTHFPWPLDVVMPPILAATAFASVMAFEQGGQIPGVGPVPIMAHGGETVVTKALTDQVRNSGGGGRHQMTYAPVIHAVDSHGVERMLTKHATVFERHVNATLRRRNQA